ncbi:MAG: hypothetical protein HC849_25725 [Oscillatoriales cyanobacterium RU_3_3]|nr:hypothetical protein [Microcoleus sp. SU_5_6]NJM62824.1 hypothetical protein [Oscillatoriales cyanobacterium RU_3_3]NJR22990.1 hypothetical protein [Richelia sp. CSU_2_1]
MPQEIKPEDNSDESRTGAAPESEQHIDAGDNSSETPTKAPPAAEQQVVRITLVGSRKAVLKTIHTLYLLGFAEVSDWSPPQPVKNSNDVASSLIRRQGTGTIEPSVKPNT